MSVSTLLRVLYLGDRGCTKIVLDGVHESVEVHVNMISRTEKLRADFATDEDIPDGMLVFTGVRSAFFSPPGPIPNDCLEPPVVKEERVPRGELSRYLFEMYLCSVDRLGNSTDVTLTIEADDLHIEDPRTPGVHIRW